MWNIHPINVISVIKNEIIGLVVRMDQQHNNGELITISSVVAYDEFSFIHSPTTCNVINLNRVTNSIDHGD